MNQQATFDHTIQVLVKAYLNDTLEQGNCQACAIGNLIAHAAGATYVRNNTDHKGSLILEAKPRIVDWLEAICTSEGSDQMTQKNVYAESPDIKRAFDSTGYSFEQLAVIEHAFESNRGDKLNASDAEQQFAGLMAVVSVLAEIHGLDQAAATQAQALFVHA